MKKLLILISLLLLLPLLVACFMLPMEETVLPPTASFAHETTSFNTIEVVRGDISVESTAIVNYRSARYFHHFFGVEDVPILGIFVNIGDMVAEGDVLAVLDVPEIMEEFEELTRNRARLQLELNQLIDRQTVLSRHALAEDRTISNTEFNRRRDSLRSEIANMDALIALLYDINEEMYLRAAVSGIVSQVASFEDGMVSNPVQNIAAISDPDVSAFIVQGIWARYMLPGDRYLMTLDGVDYEMVVIDHEAAGFVIVSALSTVFLDFANERPTSTFSNQGHIHIIAGQAHDVLLLPHTAIRQTPERTFTYVLEEGRFRVLRDLELGLEHNGIFEIISGLEEGDLVIPWG